MYGNFHPFKKSDAMVSNPGFTDYGRGATNDYSGVTVISAAITGYPGKHAFHALIFSTYPRSGTCLFMRLNPNYGTISEISSAKMYIFGL